MRACCVLFAVSFFGLLPITVLAATETDRWDTPLDHAVSEAPKTFPDLLDAWEQRFPPSGHGGGPDWIGSILQLTIIALVSLWLALSLPRYRPGRANQASRAASEISRIRWTIARSPFDRWDDR